MESFADNILAPAFNPDANGNSLHFTVADESDFTSRPFKEITPRPKSRVERSPVWRFFQIFSPSDEDNKNCRCIVDIVDNNGDVRPCNFKMRFTTPSHGTSNLFRHLRVHPEALEAAKAASSRCGLHKPLKRPDETSASLRRHIIRSTKRSQSSKIPDLSIDAWNRRYIAWSAIDLRPFNIDPGEGFRFFSELIFGQNLPQNMGLFTSKNILLDEVKNIKISGMKDLYHQYEQLKQIGPFCALQIGKISVTESISLYTLTVTYMDSAFCLKRITIKAQITPKDIGKETILALILSATAEWFDTFMPAGFQPHDVFVSATVEEGSVAFEAVSDLGIPTTVCTAAILNSYILQSLGFNDGTNELLRNCAEYFSRLFDHLAYDFLPNETETELHNILHNHMNAEVRFNRFKMSSFHWSSYYMKIACMLRVHNLTKIDREKILETDGLDWIIAKELIGILDPAIEIDTCLLLGEDASIGRATFLISELHSVLAENKQEIRINDENSEIVDVTDLNVAIQMTIFVLHTKLTTYLHDKFWSEVEGIATILDPRLKDKLGFSSTEQVEKARFDLYAAYNSAKKPREMSIQIGLNGQVGSVPKRTRLSVFEKRAAERRAQAENSGIVLNAECNEVDLYLSKGLAPDFDKSFKPQKYWKENSIEFPILSLIARQHLCVDSSVSESTRVLSGYESNLATLRCEVGDSCTESMVLIKMNKEMISGMVKMESNKVDPSTSTMAAV